MLNPQMSLSDKLKVEASELNFITHIKDERNRLIGRVIMARGFLGTGIHTVPMRFKGVRDIITITVPIPIFLLYRIDRCLKTDYTQIDKHLFNVRTVLDASKGSELLEFWNKEHDLVNKLVREFQRNRVSVIRVLEDLQFDDIAHRHDHAEYIQAVCNEIIRKKVIRDHIL